MLRNMGLGAMCSMKYLRESRYHVHQWSQATWGAGCGLCLRLFDEIRERNTASWTSLIYGYCKAGDMDSAKSLFDEMEEKAKCHTPCVCSNCYNCHCTIYGHIWEAIRLYFDRSSLLCFSLGVLFSCFQVITISVKFDCYLQRYMQ